MLNGDLMVRTNNRTLEEAPDVLQRIRMNDAAHPFFLSVVYRYVQRIVIGNALIARMFVREDGLSFIRNLRFDESVKGFFSCWQFASDSQPNVPDALNCAYDHRFVVVTRIASIHFGEFSSMNVLCLATDIC